MVQRFSGNGQCHNRSKSTALQQCGDTESQATHGVALYTYTDKHGVWMSFVKKNNKGPIGPLRYLPAEAELGFDLLRFRGGVVAGHVAASRFGCASAGYKDIN